MSTYTNPAALEAVRRRYGCSDPRACLERGYHVEEYRLATRRHKPTVVTLCGSTKFREAFVRANFEQTMAGKIVLSVGLFTQNPDDVIGYQPTAEEKIMLDELHKRKIDASDEILVLNVGGYIGDSTRSEIDYAVRHRKTVNYLEPTL